MHHTCRKRECSTVSFGQEGRLFKTSLCKSPSVPCLHPACGITSLRSLQQQESCFKVFCWVSKANQRKLEVSATKPTYRSVSYPAMLNTHRHKTLSMQNPAPHPQLSRSQRTAMALEPRNSKSQTRLPCTGWQNCLCKHRAIQAGMKRAGFADICSYRTAVPYLHVQWPPHQTGQQLEYSQAWQRHDQHTDYNFTPRTFPPQSYPRFPEQGKTV